MYDTDAISDRIRDEFSFRWLIATFSDSFFGCTEEKDFFFLTSAALRE